MTEAEFAILAREFPQLERTERIALVKTPIGSWVLAIVKEVPGEPFRLATLEVDTGTIETLLRAIEISPDEARRQAEAAKQLHELAETPPQGRA